ncbi:MAG: hypothetical protein K0S07_1577 [Chlamydiales bacterium]|jgi:dipeptidyl aminopeptidase/acylaminoacyl peptidase|nr:hypothetical protein [Chlamydiales bacterium]
MHQQSINGFLLLVILLVKATLIYGESPLIPASQLFVQETNRAIAISPDGSSVAYVAEDEKGQPFLWIQSLFSKESEKSIPQPIIPLPDASGIRKMLWQFDGQHLLLTFDHDMDGNVRLYQVHKNTRQIKDLTPYDQIFTKVIAYYPERPFEVLVQMNIPRVHLPKEKASFLPDLHKIDLRTGEITVHAPNSGLIFQWGVDSSLQVRSTLSVEENQIVIRSLNLENRWETLFIKDRDLEQEASQSPFIGFSKGGQFLYLASNIDSDKIRLLQVDLATKKYQVIAEDPRYDFSMANLFSVQDCKPLMANIIKENPTQISLDPAIDDSLNYLQREGFPRVLNTDLQGKIWLVLDESDTSPPKYYVYHSQTKEKRLIWQENSAALKYPLCKTEVISYPAQDGMEIFGYLTLPEGKKGPSPAILLIHGGPWLRDFNHYQPLVQGLANRGYAVLQINYRGSSGYGKEYMHAGFGEIGGKAQQDLLDGKAWLVKHGHAKSDQVAIMGHSFGGYTVLAGLAFTPEEFCLGIALAAPASIEIVGDPLDKRNYWWCRYFGSDPAMLKSRSPSYYSDQIKNPLLLVDGANDIAACKNEKLYRELLSRNAPVEYLLFPDEGHVIAKPKNQCALFAAIEHFLFTHLGRKSSGHVD